VDGSGACGGRLHLRAWRQPRCRGHCAQHPPAL
jgi:hypothetical protein